MITDLDLTYCEQREHHAALLVELIIRAYRHSPAEVQDIILCWRLDVLQVRP